MPYVQGKCESCGGILTVDSSLKAANCPFCGTAYVVQDSINYYNTSIKVETMHADVVNVSDESTSEGRIRAADALMKLGKYEKAELDYKKATELTPQNYRGWMGLIEARTHEYKKRTRSVSELSELEDCAKSVKIFAPEGASNELLKKYEAYRDNEVAENIKDINAYNKTIAEYTATCNQLDAQRKSCVDSLNKNRDRITELTKLITQYQKNSNNNAMIWMIILLSVGITALVVQIVVGVILLLIAGIPGFIFLFGTNRNKCRKKEVDYLVSEQSKLRLQINELIKQKNSLCNSLQSIERKLYAYK